MCISFIKRLFGISLSDKIWNNASKHWDEFDNDLWKKIFKDLIAEVEVKLSQKGQGGARHPREIFVDIPVTAFSHRYVEKCVDENNNVYYKTTDKYIDIEKLDRRLNKECFYFKRKPTAVPVLNKGESEPSMNVILCYVFEF